MKKFIILLFILFTLTPAFAIQEEKKISLKDAIELSLKTNPAIRLAKLDTDIARNNVSSSNRLQNPNLVFFQNIPKAGLGNPQQLGAEYLIEILKRGKRKETAEIYMLAAVDNQKFMEYALEAEVKKAYINLLVKKSHLKIIKEQEEITRKMSESIQKDSDEGKIPQTEAIQAKIALNRAIMYTNIARSQVITAQNEFNSIMNTSNINYDTKEDVLPLDYSLLMAISPGAEIPEFDKIKEFALENRFDLKMAKKEVEASKKELEKVKNQRIPDIELTGGYAYQTKGMSDDNHFQSGGYVGANLVNIPVLYTHKPEIQNAEIEIEKAKLKYKDAEIDAIRNITDAWEKFIIARDNLNLYDEKILINSRDLMEASEKSFNSKEIDLTSFLVSKNLYLELILGYQDTLGEYYISYAELLKELNVEKLNPEKI